MHYIKKIVEQLDEEIEGAKEYVEKSLHLKATGNTVLASKYKDMAEDELRHAMIIHDEAVAEIEKLSKVYTPPAEMMKKWEYEHKEYVERVAWIKQMLAM
jgi:ferritin